MREKLKSLPVTELRKIAKNLGVKSITTMKKDDLIEAIISANESKNAEASQNTEKTDGNQDVKKETLKDKKEKTKQSKKEKKVDNTTENTDKEKSKQIDESNEQQNSVGESDDNAEKHKIFTNEESSKRVHSQSDTRHSEGKTHDGKHLDRRSHDVKSGEGRTHNSKPGEGRMHDSKSGEGRQHDGKMSNGRAHDSRINDSKMTEENYNEGQEDKTQEAPYNGEDSKTGILEVMADGFGFIRCDNYMPGDDDVYVGPAQIRRFGLKTGDILTGRVKQKKDTDKFAALYYLDYVNGETLDKVLNRKNFEDLTPIFPNERLHLETDGHSLAMRIVDIISPIGKGQRGMIVSPPKAGKTTLLKETAKAVLKNNPDMEMIILLIDERPEEVTDIKEAITGDNVEVIYSTFDELPDHHRRVAEMVIERAKRLVEHGKDVIILLDSITRLARAYNMVVPPSGRTLSGGLDPSALNMPKKFFGAARNMREGGSLTILATALVETGSKMDDVVYEEFKGTGNMELILDRKLSERRIFPAVDIVKSGTRREDLLLSSDELGASFVIRKELNGMKKDDAVEQILNLFSQTKTNKEFVEKIGRIRGKSPNGMSQRPNR